MVTFIAGLNLDNPNDLWAQLRKDFDSTIKKVITSILPKAHADFSLLSALGISEISNFLTDDVKDRLQFIGTILGSGFVASIVIKYATKEYRKKI